MTREKRTLNPTCNSYDCEDDGTHRGEDGGRARVVDRGRHWVVGHLEGAIAVGRESIIISKIS